MENKSMHTTEKNVDAAEKLIVVLKGVSEERRTTLKTAIGALISGIEIGERLKAEEIKKSIN